MPHADIFDRGPAPLGQYGALVLAGLDLRLARREIDPAVDGGEWLVCRVKFCGASDTGRTRPDPCAGGVGSGGGTVQYRNRGNRRFHLHQPRPPRRPHQGLRLGGGDANGAGLGCGMGGGVGGVGGREKIETKCSIPLHTFNLILL